MGIPGVHCLKKVLPKHPEPSQQGMVEVVHSVQGLRQVCALTVVAARAARAALVFMAMG